MNAILPTEFHKKRRWLPRFGLRTLMVALTVTCACVGAGIFWFRSQEVEYQRQLQMAQSIRQHGGFAKWEPSVLAWTKAFRNLETFKRITGVNCGLSQGADSVAIATAIKSLPDVRELGFWERCLESDDFLDALAEIKNVREVSILFSVGGFVPIGKDKQEEKRREENMRIETGIAKVQSQMPTAKVQSCISGG